jgi:hypothetical protein
MRGNQLRHNGQTKPTATSVAGAGVVQPDEVVEDPDTVLLRDAGAVVIDERNGPAPSRSPYTPKPRSAN